MAINYRYIWLDTLTKLLYRLFAVNLKVFLLETKVSLLS